MRKILTVPVSWRMIGKTARIKEKAKMAKQKTIRPQIDQQLHERVKRWAKRHGRRIGQAYLELIDRGLQKEGDNGPVPHK